MRGIVRLQKLRYAWAEKKGELGLWSGLALRLREVVEMERYTRRKGKLSKQTNITSICRSFPTLIVFAAYKCALNST